MSTYHHSPRLTHQQFFTDEILHSYHLSDSVRANCASYYVLHWSGEMLAARITKGCIIKRQHQDYIIQWESAEQKSAAFDCPRIALSFRRLRGCNIGYVIPRLFPNSSIPS